MKCTLIIVRITLTESNAAWAGATPQRPFIRFRASMAVFNEETVFSWPFSSRWDLVFMEVGREGRRGTGAAEL